MKVKIINNTKTDIEEIIKYIKQLFNIIKEPNCFSIIFTNNEEIQKLNQFYRGKDYPTDVLSFATDGEIEGDLGDIFISLEKANAQACEYQHSLLRETLFLVVHGYLHLNGYDHQSEEEEKIMMDKTEELLSLIRLERKLSATY